MDYKISVVIPVYNASKTIVLAIESVLYQSYKVSEIILINDGSTDGSSDLINNVYKSFLEQNFIILVDKKNEGPSIARNIGVEIAKNEWVAFLDSDDQWSSTKIAEQVEIIKKNKKIKICATASNTTNFNRNATFFLVTYKMLLIKNYFSTSSVLINKEVFIRFNGFNKDQRYSEDYGLWLDVVFEQGQGLVLNKNLLIYNKDGDFKLSDRSLLMTKGELLNYKKQYDNGRINILHLFFLSLLSFGKCLKRYAKIYEK